LSNAERAFALSQTIDRIPGINALLIGLIVVLFVYRDQERYAKGGYSFLNTEKRKEGLHFRYLNGTLSKLPFVHEGHNITNRDEIYHSITDRDYVFREMFISDEISGLNIWLERERTCIQHHDGTL